MKFVAIIYIKDIFTSILIIKNVDFHLFLLLFLFIYLFFGKGMSDNFGVYSLLWYHQISITGFSHLYICPQPDVISAFLIEWPLPSCWFLIFLAL